MIRTLDVYMHDALIGKLIQRESGGLTFSYDTAYVEAGGMALSLSLPLQKDAYDDDRVKAFFSGLLPDELIRDRVARFYHVSKENPFALLKAIGGECAGSVSLYPEGTFSSDNLSEPDEVLTEEKLADLLSLLDDKPLMAGEKGVRLSLAGAQNKMAVGYADGRVFLVKGGRPTTHIIKPPIKNSDVKAIESSVYNEHFCMRLAKAVGIDVPHTEILYVKGAPFFMVERYDRLKNKEGKIIRVHQEDFCQALGLLPELKYENQGGPSLQKCKELIGQYSAQPALDLIKLMDRFVFNYIIGNADAHGKNFSFLYNNAIPVLAPAYDLISTAVYPELDSRMAMKIGGKYKPDDVYLRHWHRTVLEMKSAEKYIENLLQKMSQKMCSHMVPLSKKIKEQEGGAAYGASCAIDDICNLIEKRSQRIEKDLKR